MQVTNPSLTSETLSLRSFPSDEYLYYIEYNLSQPSTYFCNSNNFRVTRFSSNHYKLCLLKEPSYPTALLGSNFIDLSSDLNSGHYTYLARSGATTQPIKPKNPCSSFQVGEYAILSLLIN